MERIWLWRSQKIELHHSRSTPSDTRVQRPAISFLVTNFFVKSFATVAAGLLVAFSSPSAGFPRAVSVSQSQFMSPTCKFLCEYHFLSQPFKSKIWLQPFLLFRLLSVEATSLSSTRVFDASLDLEFSSQKTAVSRTPPLTVPTPNAFNSESAIGVAGRLLRCNSASLAARLLSTHTTFHSCQCFALYTLFRRIFRLGCQLHSKSRIESKHVSFFGTACSILFCEQTAADVLRASKEPPCRFGLTCPAGNEARRTPECTFLKRVTYAPVFHVVSQVSPAAFRSTKPFIKPIAHEPKLQQQNLHRYQQHNLHIAWSAGSNSLAAAYCSLSSQAKQVHSAFVESPLRIVSCCIVSHSSDISSSSRNCSCLYCRWILIKDRFVHNRSPGYSTHLPSLTGSFRSPALAAAVLGGRHSDSESACLSLHISCRGALCRRRQSKEIAREKVSGLIRAHPNFIFSTLPIVRYTCAAAANKGSDMETERHANNRHAGSASAAASRATAVLPHAATVAEATPQDSVSTLSKKAQKKLEKGAARAAAQAAKREALEAEQCAGQALLNTLVEDLEKDLFGYLSLIEDRNGTFSRQWTAIEALEKEQHEPFNNTQQKQNQKRFLDESGVGEKCVWIRGRIQESRGKGNLAFLLVRDRQATIQCLLDARRGSSKEAIKWACSVPPESVVDIYGVLCTPEVPVASASVKNQEIFVKKIFCVSKAAQELPFQLRDAMRPEDEMKEGVARVSLETRLDNRVLDLRTRANYAILGLVSATCQLFREFLLSQRFIEIHSPKLIGGASEGGASCFSLKYFGQDACLAQSPQLYKQMAICADLDRVFEIGPVFRAENSNTHRHLCEFTGVDVEMSFKEHYSEVLDLLDKMFKYVFENLSSTYKHLVDIVREYHPAEPFTWSKNTPRLKFTEGVQLLREAGCTDIPDDITHFDLNTEQEKTLGKLVKQIYGTDYYMLLQYPLGVRPFYTMPDPHDKKFSNSFDFFMRNEEITSGAQRVHDTQLLLERCRECGIPTNSIKAYIDAFALGAPPHGGAGIGLERVVMLFLGLKNIRQVCMFPRDPKRLTP